MILESDLCFLYTVVPPFQDPCGYLNPRMLKSSMHDGYRSGRSVCGMQTLYITVLRSAPKRPIAFELFSSLRTMPSWSESRLQSSFPEGKERPGGWEIQSLGLRSMKNWVWTVGPLLICYKHFWTPLQSGDKNSTHRSVVQFSSVAQSVRFFATPWTAARQVSLSITSSWSLLKLMSVELVMLYSVVERLI